MVFFISKPLLFSSAISSQCLQYGLLLLFCLFPFVQRSCFFELFSIVRLWSIEWWILASVATFSVGFIFLFGLSDRAIADKSVCCSSGTANSTTFFLWWLFDSICWCFTESNKNIQVFWNIKLTSDRFSRWIIAGINLFERFFTQDAFDMFCFARLSRCWQPGWTWWSLRMVFHCYHIFKTNYRRIWYMNLWKSRSDQS